MYIEQTSSAQSIISAQNDIASYASPTASLCGSGLESLVGGTGEASGGQDVVSQLIGLVKDLLSTILGSKDAEQAGDSAKGGGILENLIGGVKDLFTSIFGDKGLSGVFSGVASAVVGLFI